MPSIASVLDFGEGKKSPEGRGGKDHLADPAGGKKWAFTRVGDLSV